MPTSDITATGKILSSPPTQSQQPQSQPFASDETFEPPMSIPGSNPPSSISSSFSTLSLKSVPLQEVGIMSITEMSPAQQFRPGYEGGYKNSPMFRLMQEYQEERDDVSSTQQRAMNLYAKKTLATRDIIYLDSADTNIALVDNLLTEATQVIGELQIFLEQTSGLIPKRRSFFKVDPKGTFIDILNGASDLAELYTAWFGLNKRIGLAQENLVKDG